MSYYMYEYTIIVQPTNWTYPIKVEANSDGEALIHASQQENVDLEYLSIKNRIEI